MTFQRRQNLKEIKKPRPVAGSSAISEGQDFSDLNAKLLRIRQQKETKKK